LVHEWKRRREEGGGIPQSAGVDLLDMVCVAGSGITKGRERTEVGDNGATVAGNQS